MRKNITKTKITTTLNKEIVKIMNEEIGNKSKYVEWLIYQDLLKNSNNDRIKKIIV